MSSHHRLSVPPPVLPPESPWADRHLPPTPMGPPADAPGTPPAAARAGLLAGSRAAPGEEAEGPEEAARVLEAIAMELRDRGPDELLSDVSGGRLALVLRGFIAGYLSSDR